MNEITATQPTSVATVETSASAVAAQSKALIEARYTVAINRPRDWDNVRSKLLKDCRRPGFADAAIYNKPVGKGIEGPSIRFAEAAVRNMGNIVVETMTVFDDNSRRIVRVSVTDLEANVPYSQDVTIEKSVERSSTKSGDNVLRTRTNSYGKPVYTIEATDDDILNKANALVSKAVRTLGLRLLPGDILDECMAACKETQRNQDAVDPDAARRRVFDLFATQGVSPENLKAWLGHDGAKISQREHEQLRGMFNALRDGETNWREIMDAKAPKVDDKTAKVTVDLNAAAAAAAATREASK